MVESVGGGDDRSASRLISVTIEGFRGFNRSVTLNFDASAVLLHGPNGSGKTSVFDAIQWLFTSEIPRLAPFGLRKTDQYLRNAFSDASQGRVNAVFRVAGKTIQVERRGDHRTSVLEVEDEIGRTNGAAAAQTLKEYLAPGSLPLAEVLHTSGLLQQDDLRQILKTKPDDRYRQLMRLLGLEALEQFEQFVRERKTSARSRLAISQRTYDETVRKHEAATEQLETAELQAQRVAATVDVREAVDRALTPYPGIWKLEAIDIPSDRLADLTLEVGRRRAEITTLRQRLAAIPTDLPADEYDSTEILDQRRQGAEATLARAVQALAVAQNARNSIAHVGDSLARLSAAALPLLPETHDLTSCPVCSTPIDPLHVRDLLNSRSSEGSDLAAADEDLASAQAMHRAAMAVVNELETIRRSKAEVEAGRLRLQQEFSSIRRLVRGLASGSEFGFIATNVESAEGLASFEEFVGLRGPTDAYLSVLEASASAVESALQTLGQQQAAMRLAIERQSALPRQRQTVAQLANEVQTAVDAVERDRKLATAAATLADGTMSANSSIFRQRFQTLEPLMNDVYSRLDPHPAFTHLSFNVESFRSKPTASATVRDAQRDISMNPMLIFSSAQANIVVLSAFLALGWAAGNGSLPFVMLDDPLQAMDDVNVLGFADLARHLRRDRQLVLATHEARFADLLERKLSGVRRGEDLIVHKFIGWSRGGPEIETTEFDHAHGATPRVLTA